jgi:hypothetical protein
MPNAESPDPPPEPAGHLDRDDGDHTFVDQSVIDFDPDAGLYSGTAVDGTTEIPGPHVDQDSGELDPDEQPGS